MWMCGGIIGTLTLSLQKEIQNNKTQIFFYVLAYNLGRIGSYTFLGFSVGLLSGVITNLIDPLQFRLFTRIFTSLLMFGIGLYLAGWFPRLALIETVGKPLWKFIEPIGRRMLPVRNFQQAFAFGLVWGFIPCGLSYTMLLLASTSGSASKGALTMFCYGLGTLPSIMVAGLFTNWLARLTRLRYLNYIFGVAFILMALMSLLLATRWIAM
jgi:hypothetical protein